MTRVWLERCDLYEENRVRECVYNLLDQGNVAEELRGKKKVVVKANLLAKKTPEQVVTTHPLVIKAICEYVGEQGIKPIIVDSPAGPFIKANLDPIYHATGMTWVSENTQATLNYDIGYTEVNVDDAVMLKHFDIINVILDADYIINAAKFKTHGMMTFTGAVKNLYGTIPGLTKANYHFKLQEPVNFAHHLLDICQVVKPCFNIIDGIHAMEGDGPSSGTKRELGLILGSKCAYSLDDVAVQVAGIDYKGVPTIVQARERNLYNHSGINWDKEIIKGMNIEAFKLPKSISVNFLSGRVPKFAENIALKAVRSKPKFIHSKCISCGHCVRNCPPKIISLSEGKPNAELSKCISCFCCHEVCPADAVKIKTPLVSKMFFPTKH